MSQEEDANAVPSRQRSLRLWATHARLEDITADCRASTADSPIAGALLGRGKEVLLLSSISRFFVVGHVAVLRNCSF